MKIHEPTYEKPTAPGEYILIRGDVNTRENREYVEIVLHNNELIVAQLRGAGSPSYSDILNGTKLSMVHRSFQYARIEH